MITYLLHSCGVPPNYHLDLEDPSPSNNVIKSMHFHAYRKLRMDWAGKVLRAIGRELPEKPLEKAGLVVVRHSGYGFLDWDNAYGGVKPLFDSLVCSSAKNPDGLGLIRDDNPVNVPESPIFIQQKSSRKEGRTEIFIYDLESPLAGAAGLLTQSITSSAKNELEKYL